MVGTKAKRDLNGVWKSLVIISQLTKTFVIYFTGKFSASYSIGSEYETFQKCERQTKPTKQIIKYIKVNYYYHIDNSYAISLHKKWSFPLRISLVNVNKSAGNCGFVHIY